jgi:hypothetical protein
MANKVTHMGVPPSDHVELVMVDRWDFRRVTPSGRTQVNFEVPEGKMLVLTDFMGHIGDATPQTSVYIQLDRLYGGVGVYTHRIVGVADIDGSARLRESLTSGLVYASGTRFGVGAWSGDFPYSVFMYGYLVDSSE